MTTTSLVGVQRRFTEIGRIRLGEKKVSKGGKTYPAKLETIRLTSPSVDALKVAAELYGGSVERWEEQYEIVTERDRIPVAIPPRPEGIAPYSLSYELWSGGGCQRRCDGADATVYSDTGFEVAPCVCASLEERECKPTLRVSLLLPELPGFGVWRLETKGYNAAAELPGMLDLLAGHAAGRMMPAILRLEQRTSKQAGQTRNFVVPVIDLGVTLQQLIGPQLSAPVELPQVPSNGHAPAPVARLTSSSVPSYGDEPAIPGDEESPIEQPDTPPAGAAGTRVPAAGSSARSGTAAPASTPKPRAAKVSKSVKDPGYWNDRVHALSGEKGIDHDGLRNIAAAVLGVATTALSLSEDDPDRFSVTQMVDAEWELADALLRGIPEPLTDTSFTEWLGSVAPEFTQMAPAAMDILATTATGKRPNALTVADWIALAVRLNAGEYATPVKPPPVVTA